MQESLVYISSSMIFRLRWAKTILDIKNNAKLCSIKV